ncbi:MAG: sulfite exporter TauE/SafE family protein, partial [Anaerolineae bacterium]
MAARSSLWVRTQIPTVILLLIIAAVVIWAVAAGQVEVAGHPLTAGQWVLLLVVGFAAGLLGGLIGTGGCSVMLPIIHFW